MRKRKLAIALLAASACPGVGSAYADNVWQGSYSANGQCFCSGEVAQSIASRIVPTPIGGQTVKQVCAQLGQGPGLVKQDGLFNHTVYKDPQCGNGPFVNNSGPRDTQCVGSIDGTYASCQSAGPKWELATAYTPPGTPAAAIPAVDTNATQADDQLPTSTSTSTSTSSKTNNEVIDQQVKVASQSQTKDVTLNEKSTKSGPTRQSAALTQLSVMLGEDRYMRARAGIPAQGGAPGSRIILDGFVYLKDDGSLQVEDLYKEADSPDLASANPESTSAAVADVKKKTDEPPTAIAAKKPDVGNAADALVVKQVEARDTIVAIVVEEPEAKNTAAKKTEAVDSSDTKQIESASKSAQPEAAEKIDNAQQVFELKKHQELRTSPAPAPIKIEKQANSASKNGDLEEASSATRAAEIVAETTDPVAKDPSDSQLGAESAVLTALRLPTHTRASSRNFSYVELLPTAYDIGGNGLMIEGSAQSFSRIQYIGSLGVTDSFREIMVGAGYYVTPAAATRMTLVLLAGIEYGSFELSDEVRAPGLTITSSDNGLFLGAVSRFVVNNKFELRGGVGYSSFFEGDATFIGGGYYHVTPRLDVISRFEFGDNDSLGIGIRYYY